MKTKKILSGLAWYTEAQWPEYCRVMEDRGDETFEGWLAHATDIEAKLKKEGVDVVRCPIDIGEFALWCLQKGKRKDSSARALYVLEVLKMDRPNQSSEPTLSSVTPPAKQESRPR
jgi:hypothetical protein